MFAIREEEPTAVLLFAVVLFCKALVPTEVLLEPVVVDSRVPLPNAVL